GSRAKTAAGPREIDRFFSLTAVAVDYRNTIRAAVYYVEVIPIIAHLQRMAADNQRLQQGQIRSEHQQLMFADESHVQPPLKKSHRIREVTKFAFLLDPAFLNIQYRYAAAGVGPFLAFTRQVTDREMRLIDKSQAARETVNDKFAIDFELLIDAVNLLIVA